MPSGTSCSTLVRYRPDFSLVACPITRSALLLRLALGSEQEPETPAGALAGVPLVRGSGSDDLTFGVAHSHVGLATASSPTTRATSYVELGARELGGAVVFSPKRSLRRGESASLIT